MYGKNNRNVTVKGGQPFQNFANFPSTLRTVR